MQDRALLALGAAGVIGLGLWWWSSRPAVQQPARLGEIPAPVPGQPGVAPGAVPLPPLPFAVTALAPIVSERTVKAHHEVHQQRYVDGLNQDLAQIWEIRRQGYAPEVRRPMRLAVAESLSYNLGGAHLHDLYWRSLAPQGQGGAPSPALLAQIQRDFGSLGALAEELTDIGLEIRGSGWAVLAWSPYLGRLIVLAVGEHDNRVPPGVVPLLPIDVWEHAYYLDHGPDRGAYLRQFWGIVDWSALSTRFAEILGGAQPAAGARPAQTPSRPTAAGKPAASNQEPDPEEPSDAMAAERARRRKQSAKMRATRRAEHRETLERGAA